MGFHNFSNVRYAAPPTVENRFRVPVPPVQNRSHIHDGSKGRVCPQATPGWALHIGPRFVEDYLQGREFNGSANVSSYPYIPPVPDPRVTEDCLFLDVLVPEKILARAQNPRRPSKAPVLVWIHGGGYTTGEKGSFTGASGLMQKSMEQGEGMIIVSINYRVWSSLLETFIY